MYLYDEITVGHPSLLVFARLDMYDKIVAVRRGTIYKGFAAYGHSEVNPKVRSQSSVDCSSYVNDECTSQ